MLEKMQAAAAAPPDPSWLPLLSSVASGARVSPGTCFQKLPQLANSWGESVLVLVSFPYIACGSDLLCPELRRVALLPSS